jgi:subfamily B ATP-binding cassette protein HlyB/CyaB
MHDRITKTDSVTETDPGLFVLVMLLRLLGIGADPEQIRHRFGGARIGIPEILRCAKEFGLKARERIAGWERLETTPMPAIAVLRDGGFPAARKIRRRQSGRSVAAFAAAGADDQGRVRGNQ